MQVQRRAQKRGSGRETVYEIDPREEALTQALWSLMHLVQFMVHLIRDYFFGQVITAN